MGHWVDEMCEQALNEKIIREEKEMIEMHEEKEKRGKLQFDALPQTKKVDFDESSFIEGFIYGVIDTERQAYEKSKKS